MADRPTPDSQPTPEQRIDAAITSARYGQAGLGSLNTGQYFDSGGGGAGGQFVFADLATLNAIIDRWTAVHNRIQERNRKIGDAIKLCKPPAHDMMSVSQADATPGTSVATNSMVYRTNARAMTSALPNGSIVVGTL